MSRPNTTTHNINTSHKRSAATCISPPNTTNLTGGGGTHSPLMKKAKSQAIADTANNNNNGLNHPFDSSEDSMIEDSNLDASSSTGSTVSAAGITANLSRKKGTLPQPTKKFVIKPFKDPLPLPTVSEHSLKEKVPAIKKPAAPRTKLGATKRPAEESSHAPASKKGKDKSAEPIVLDAGGFAEAAAPTTTASDPSWLAEDFIYPHGDVPALKSLTKELEPPAYISKIDLDARGVDAMPGSSLLARVADKAQWEKMTEVPASEIVGRSGIQVCELASNLTALAEKAQRAESRAASLAEKAQRAESRAASLRRQLEEAKKFAANSLAGLEAANSALEEKVESLTNERNGLQGSVNSLNEVISRFDQKRKEDEDFFRGREESIKSAAVEEFCQSEDFSKRVMAEVVPVYNQGRNHILRMAADHGIPQDILASWAASGNFGEQARRQAAILPYSSDDLETIKEMDIAAGLDIEWVPPPPQPFTLDYVIDLIRRGGEAKLVDGDWVCTEPVESPEEFAPGAAVEEDQVFHAETAEPATSQPELAADGSSLPPVA